jgi:patatin-like phospholipase/acyl hydrolase
LLKQYLVRDGRPLTLRDTIKPVLIPCYDLATAGPFLFSRADALENQTWNFNLWEVCRATTAVPSFFKPAYMKSVDGNTSCTAVDGGVVMHNPTAAAVTHVLHNKLEFPRVRGVHDLLVLSLGTGQMEQTYGYQTVRGWGSFKWVKPIAKIVLESISDMIDHTISMSFGDFRQQYLRIQVFLQQHFLLRLWKGKKKPFV